MIVTWRELEEFGVDWEELCRVKGWNLHIMKEGFLGEEDDILITIENLKILVPKLRS